jgi:serine/threonine-protein kinase
MKALAKDRTQRYQSARELQSALEDFVRKDRIPVSNVALTQYMQSLFEEKLKAQKEQILQGKQLADIIDLQQENSLSEADGVQRLSSSLLSAPSAARTVTDIHPVPRSRTVITMVAALGTIALAAAGYAWSVHQKPKAVAVQLPPPPPPAAVNRGAISVTSDPPGASIWIDGEMRAEVSPAEILQLPLGRSFELRVSKEGYEAAKNTLALSEEQPTAKWDAHLTRGSVTVDLSVRPRPDGLAVFLDGKPLENVPATGITSGDQHKLLIGAPGYIDQTYTFIAAPQENKKFDVVLVKEPHRAKGAPPPPVVPHSSFDPPPVVPPPVVVPVGKGKLNVGVSPGWCNVSVDGVARGPTPLAGLELPSGTHRVVCTPPDAPAMTATVNVTSDNTTRYRFKIPQ